MREYIRMYLPQKNTKKDINRPNELNKICCHRTQKSFFISILFFSISSPAYAYVDPGTGAYFIQLIMAFIGAGVFYLRHPIKLLKSLLSRIKKKKPDCN